MKKINAAAPLTGAEIEEEIKRFLLEAPDIVLSVQDLAVDQSLISSGLIDSLAVLDIIAFLEFRFDLRFEHR